MGMLKELTTFVLFTATLDKPEADTWITELRLNAGVTVAVLDTITNVDIFDILEGGTLCVVGVAVTPITCLLTLCLASFF